jgi:superoxide dismutase, Cu-Zn family
MRLGRFVPLIACFVVSACANGTPTGSSTPAEGGTPSAWIRYQGGESSGPGADELLPGEAAGPSEVASGTFLPFRPGATAITYDPKVVPPGARVRLAITKTPSAGLVVRLTAAGLVPRRPYVVDLHTQPCTATPASAGPQYQHSQDPSSTNPNNEVWLDFTADPDGAGTAVSQEKWTFAAETPPRSLVIGEELTRTGNGVAGAAGCLTL